MPLTSDRQRIAGLTPEGLADALKDAALLTELVDTVKDVVPGDAVKAIPNFNEPVTLSYETAGKPTYSRTLNHTVGSYDNEKMMIGIIPNLREVYSFFGYAKDVVSDEQFIIPNGRMGVSFWGDIAHVNNGQIWLYNVEPSFVGMTLTCSVIYGVHE